jgi:hypothetical protein
LLQKTRKNKSEQGRELEREGAACTSEKKEENKSCSTALKKRGVQNIPFSIFGRLFHSNFSATEHLETQGETRASTLTVLAVFFIVV